MWWLLLNIALAEPISVSELVDADPETVHAVVSDLENWLDLWQLRAADDASRVHYRGDPATTRQVLSWSAGETARGRMRLDTVQSDSVTYTVEWGKPSRLTSFHMRPNEHSGRITWTPEGEQTRVVWEIDHTGPLKPVERQAQRALDQLAQRATQPIQPRPDALSVVEHDAVLAWLGFRHRWTYNHRINRAGDWWELADCDAEGCDATHTHAAASGSGIDRAHYSASGALLSADGVTGWYGVIPLWFDGKEGELLSDQDCVTLPEGAKPGPALLRGFDMDAVESADSLWELQLHIERTGDQVCATGRIRMDCKTPECGSEKLTTYAIDVPFVVAAGEGLTSTTAKVSRSYEWKAKDIRDQPISEPLSSTLPGDESRPSLIGIAGLSFQLDHAQHTLGMDLHVGPDAMTQPVTEPFDVALFYAQWGPVEIAPMTVAQFAHEGSAELELELVRIQPPTGCAAVSTIDGTSFWPGKSADASVPLAESQTPVRFQPSCASIEVIETDE